MLTIRLLGDLEVRDDGAPLALPPSRKTRLLLAYLAVTARPQRRERLCELLWDLPDDPRGALRWSLSKLRALLDREGTTVVTADRQTVALQLAPDQVDLLEVRALLRPGIDAAPTDDLIRAADCFRGPFLADLDAPRSPEMQSWLAGLREETRRLHATVLTELDDRHEGSPEQAVGFVRDLVRLDSYAEESWARLIRRLREAGRQREADEQYAAARNALAEVGGVGHVLEEALTTPLQELQRQKPRARRSIDADVELGAAPPARQGRPRVVLAAIAAVVALAIGASGLWLAFEIRRDQAHAKSVAVLPFEDLSPGKTEQLFAAGLTQEVESNLAQTPDLRVAGRWYGGAPSGDLKTIARSAGVANVLRGSVRRSGDHTRVTVDLVRAADGVHLWSQSYDSSGDDIISIQEQIGVQIARALKTVADPTRLQAMSAAGTRSVAAYEAYLRGLALDRRQLEEGDLRYAREAAEAYEQARSLDPTFAAAQWRAAQNWFGRATRVDADTYGSGSEAERLARFFERVDAAIATSKDETESLQYRAAEAVMRLHFRRAQQLMGEYVKARPRDIDAWEQMAQLSAWAGDRPGLLRAARRVHELSMEARDPRSRAITLLVMGMRPEEALADARRQLELRPNSALVLYQAHRAAIWAGRPREARGYLDRLRASFMPRQNMQLAELRQACAEDRRADAARWFSVLYASPRPDDRFHAAQIAGRETLAVHALAPLDAPGRLPTLMQFMIYPTFDAAPFPNLSASLAADGVTLPRPVPTPHGCRGL